jgi:hypothetical protein
VSQLGRVYRGFVLLLALPVVLAEYFRRETGREHGIGAFAKARLMARIVRNTFTVPTESNFFEHLTMVARILALPASVPGVVVECGCFQGGSTTNLSLACEMVGRRLHVFDSFEGLPEPEAEDRSHALVDTGELHTYTAGAFAGSLETVKGNIARHGAIAVCEFHRGYFQDTMPAFSEPCAFAFLDVDLYQSLEPCLLTLWPLLRDDCSMFVHEARHMEIAGAFFDRQWWRERMDAEPPGLVGAGNGLGLLTRGGPFGSNLGYAVKRPHAERFEERPQVGRAGRT